MTRLGDLRKGLKDRLATIPSLKPYATMPANPQVPSAAVIPRSKTPLSLDDDNTYRFAIWVYVNSTDLNRAQTAIDEYLSDDGANSIEAAIEGDQSLGGVAYSAVVTGWSEYAQLVDIGDAKLLGARLDVEVMA
jgi:hypothetical protein